MAKCFPDNPDDLPPMTSGVINFWKLLKNMPDNAKAWIGLRPAEHFQEFLLLFDEDKPVYLIYVSDANHVNEAVDLIRNIYKTYFCPVALVSKTLNSGGLFTDIPQWLPFMGNAETSSPKRFLQAINPYINKSVDKSLIQSLRAKIAPEIAVPVQSIARKQMAETAIPTTDLGEYALDYQQEDILKKDLLLSKEGKDALEARARVITGVAGSGKSLILVHKAKLLAELNPECSCLILTHNHALCEDLELRFHRLNNLNHSQVYWSTFAKWCKDGLNGSEYEIGSNDKVISPYRRIKLIEKIHENEFADTFISVTMLTDEFDWIKDNLFFTRQDYLQADRQGRGFGLNESQRDKVFAALLEYYKLLNDSPYECDWFDLPRRLWKVLEDGHSIPQHDVVMLDEAQFLPPIAFELVKRTLKPGGHILFSADPTQGFLKRRLSWLSMGIDIRGRSHRLRQCYRTTRSILEFASSFYRKRLGEDEPDIDLSDEEALSRMTVGKPPVIEAVDARQAEHAYITSEIIKLLREGATAKDILLLHADSRRVDEIAELLRKQCSTAEVCNMKSREKYTGKEMRVCALDSATGLEAAIVFVLGAGHLLEQEESLDLTPEDKAELFRNNTRKLYMAFTRASTRLILTLPQAISSNGIFSELKQVNL